MKNKIDNILLGILWLIAVILGASFWFNTIFGFNIFSLQHWEYLSYLQAAKSPINSTFYISLVVVLFIALFGLYTIVRPKLRKIKLPKMHISSNNAPIKSDIQPSVKNDASTLDILPIETQPSNQQTPTTKSSGTRPPRLNIPTFIPSNYTTENRAMPLSHLSTANSDQPSDLNYSEIKEIFSNAGYTVKQDPRINGIKTSLFAIGTNETLWMGAVGIKTTELNGMIEKLSQIFSDTLDDIYININGFIIDAPDASTTETQDILLFKTISELRTYIQDVPNPALPDDDDGNFEAYSQYIDTVINYIGKI